MELSDRILNEIEWLEQDLMWWEETGCEWCPDDQVGNCPYPYRENKYSNTNRSQCLSKKEEALRKEIKRLRETGQLADSEELEAKHGQGRLF